MTALRCIPAAPLDPPVEVGAGETPVQKGRDLSQAQPTLPHLNRAGRSVKLVAETAAFAAAVKAGSTSTARIVLSRI